MKILQLIMFSILMLGINLYAKSDTIVIGVENETARINPLFDEDHDSALDFVYSGLVKFDENMQIAPDLALSWEISDDKKTYKFTLRDDAFWHDGEKFSAKDAEFTLKTAMSDELNAPAKANFELIDEIKVIDDTHIEISLKTPFEPFLATLNMGMLPKHLLENENISTTNFNNAPVGTGPYKLDEWKKGQYLKFSAFDKYYGTTPKTQNIYLKFIPDFSVAAIQLQKGEIDATLISPAMVENIQKNNNIKILKESSADYRALMFNMKNEIFQDKNVRIAINYAIDKNLIVEALIHGYGSVANGPIDRDWANDESIKGFEFDPKKAENILQNAGYSKDKDGIYQKDGKKLEFDIYTFNTDPLRVAIANAISSDLAKIGIKATPYSKPHGSFEISEVDTFILGWGSPFDPDLHTYRVFGSSSDSDINEGGWNYSHYSDNAVDEALKNARSALTKSERKEWYSKFLQALNENPPFVFVAYLDFPLAYSAKISGIKPHVLGHHGAGFAWNVSEWEKE
ncbi:MAG: ABC transporter substrate-binding protein [Campylobacter sp.]|nr:ABC transporter substrate-binding protein [Campylobacter sp.]